MEVEESANRDWMTEEEWGRTRLGKSKRQVARLRKQLDGLPYAVLGKEIMIHVPTGDKWLLSRLINPNPTRGSRR